MKSNVLFLIIWGALIVLGTIGSLLMHIDLSVAGAVSAWAEHDVIFVLIYGWLISAFIILYLYVRSIKVEKKDEAKDENKDNAENKAEAGDVNEPGDGQPAEANVQS